MWCLIQRWNISRAMDSGRPPAGLTKRHVERCASCREFNRVGRELEKRLAAEAAALIGSTDPSLAGRVTPAAMEAQSFRPGPPSQGRPRFLGLRPAWAAAASLAIVVGISLIWTVTSPPAKMPPLDPLLKLDGPRAFLESALERAESPYEEEVLELRQAIESTADYLLSRLDINLGPEK